MGFTFKGNVAELRKGIDIMLKDCTFEKDMEISVVKTGDNLLEIEKNKNMASITYSHKTSFFRGLSLLIYNIDEENYCSREDIVYTTIGNMLDCSRNAVLKVSMVKKIIRRMAKMGMNVLMLYTEDTYELKNHPYFGAYRGRYTPQELKDIDDYADIFGIEVIPCIQTLAHLHNILKWPEFTDLQDGRDIIEAGREETYKLLEEMIDAVSNAFRSKRIHLGMDEALGLGLGNYLKHKGYRDSRTIMKEHMDKVFEICRTRGLKPMIWSDVYISSNTGLDYYETPAKVDTTDWEKPQELGLVYWDYYHHTEDVYINNLTAHMAISNQVIFAGGSWIWNGLAPNLEKAEHSTITALNVCKKLGIKEVICTNWQDNGAETSIEAAYPIMTLFAEMGYGHNPDTEVLENSFDRCFGGSYEAMMQLSEFDHVDPDNFKNQRADTTSKFVFYQDPMIGIFDKQIERFNLTDHYHKLAEKLSLTIQDNLGQKKIMKYYLVLAKALEIKAELGIRIKRAYDEENRDELEKIISTDIPACRKLITKLMKKRQKLWMQDCKPFGYELIDIRMGGVNARLRSTAKRLEDYVNGRVSRLEELEEPRLMYRPLSQGKERELCYEAHWQRIISGCDLDDTI